MKTIFKIPVLLLALMLVVSCGDSKKEKEEEEKLSLVEQAAADGKKAGELYCKVVNAIANSDYEDLEKLTKESQDFGAEMEKKYLGLEANEEVKKAFNDAMMAANKNCI